MKAPAWINGALPGQWLVEPGQGRVLLFLAAMMILIGWTNAGWSGWGDVLEKGRPDQGIWIEVVSPDVPGHVRFYDHPLRRSTLLKSLGLPVPENLTDETISRSCRVVVHRDSPQITSRPLSGAACLALGRPIQVNLAHQRDLVRISGLGPVTARRIILDRDRNGPFSSVQDLVRVRGIGPETIARIAPYITTENDGCSP